MGRRKECPNCYPYEQMFRAYIRKYETTWGKQKAKWIPKGWICDSCDLFIPDEKEK